MTMTNKQKQEKIDAFVAQVKAARNGTLTLGDTQKIFLFLETLQEKQNSQIVKNLNRKDRMQ